MERKTKRTNPFAVCGALFLATLIVIFSAWAIYDASRLSSSDYLDICYTTLDKVEGQAYQGYWGSQQDAFDAAKTARRRYQRLVSLTPPNYFSRLYSFLTSYTRLRMRSFYSRYQRPSGSTWREEKEMADNIFREVLSELYRIEVM